MRRALIALCALILDASLFERATAAQVCAWIVESVEDDGTHKFELNLGADAPTAVAVGFAGPGFTSASLGGDLIQLDAGDPKDVDGEGFDVSPGDDLHFDVRLFDHAIASLDGLKDPANKPVARFALDRKVGASERSPPGFAKQCQAIG